VNRGVSKQKSQHHVIQVISNILEVKFASNVNRIVKNAMGIRNMTVQNARVIFMLTMEVACLNVNQVMNLIKLNHVKNVQLIIVKLKTQTQLAIHSLLQEILNFIVIINQDHIITIKSPIS